MQLGRLLLYLLSLEIVCIFSLPIDFYDRSQVISKEDGYQLFWKVKNDEIYLAIQVRTNGWVGFGIAEQTSGSMPGADMLIGK